MTDNREADLKAEVERLTGSLEVALRRLEQDGHPEDRIRFARLHIEAALDGVSAPLALSEAALVSEREVVFVGGPSPRGVPHQVLYRDGVLWHDPHPSKAGLLRVDEGDLWVIRPAGRHDHEPTSEAQR